MMIYALFFLICAVSGFALATRLLFKHDDYPGLGVAVIYALSAAGLGYLSAP